MKELSGRPRRTLIGTAAATCLLEERRGGTPRRGSLDRIRGGEVAKPSRSHGSAPAGLRYFFWQSGCFGYFLQSTGFSG
jgi:hypothetical protein